MSSLQHQLQLICLVALGLGPVIPVTSLATPTIFREEVNLEHCQIQQFHIPINEHCQEEESCVTKCTETRPDLGDQCLNPFRQVCHFSNFTQCQDNPDFDPFCQDQQCEFLLEDNCNDLEGRHQDQCQGHQPDDCVDDGIEEECRILPLDHCNGDNLEDIGKKTCEMRRDVICDCPKTERKCHQVDRQMCMIDHSEQFKRQVASPLCQGDDCNFGQQVQNVIFDDVTDNLEKEEMLFKAMQKLEELEAARNQGQDGSVPEEVRSSRTGQSIETQEFFPTPPTPRLLEQFGNPNRIGPLNLDELPNLEEQGSPPPIPINIDSIPPSDLPVPQLGPDLPFPGLEPVEVVQEGFVVVDDKPNDIPNGFDVRGRQDKQLLLQEQFLFNEETFELVKMPDPLGLTPVSPIEPPSLINELPITPEQTGVPVGPPLLQPPDLVAEAPKSGGGVSVPLGHPLVHPELPLPIQEDPVESSLPFTTNLHGTPVPTNVPPPEASLPFNINLHESEVHSNPPSLPFTTKIHDSEVPSSVPPPRPAIANNIESQREAKLQFLGESHPPPEDLDHCLGECQTITEEVCENDVDIICEMQEEMVKEVVMKDKCEFALKESCSVMPCPDLKPSCQLVEETVCDQTKSPIRKDCVTPPPVCKLVKETLCDGFVPVRGILLDKSSVPLKPKDELNCQDEFREVCVDQPKVCHDVPVTKERCRQKVRQQCGKNSEPGCQNGLRTTCSKVPHEVCHQVPVVVERLVKNKKCSMVPTIKCQKVPRTMCHNNCPTRQGKELLDHCFDVPQKECGMEPIFGRVCPKEKCRPISVQVCHMLQPGCQIQECRTKRKETCHHHKRCQRDKPHHEPCQTKTTRKCLPCPSRQTCVPTVEQKCHQELKPECVNQGKRECGQKCNAVYMCPVCKEGLQRQPKFHASAPGPSHAHGSPALRPDIAQTLKQLRAHQQQQQLVSSAPPFAAAAASQDDDIPTYSKGGW